MCGLRLPALVAAAVIGAATMVYGQATGVCVVAGTVSDRGHPLPGVVVSLNEASGKIADISSSVPDGTFELKAKAGGLFAITADLLGFATASRDLTIDLSACPVRFDVSMTLLPSGFSPDTTEAVTTIGNAQASAAFFGGPGGADAFAQRFGSATPNAPTKFTTRWPRQGRERADWRPPTCLRA